MKNLLRVTALSFLHFLTIYMVRPYISLLAVNAGAGNMEIGLIAGAYGLIQVVLALYAGKIVDRIGPRIPAMCGSVA